jgi:gliding motility-associated-like protein
VTSNGETLFSIEIYSRWGNLVFKRSGHQQRFWDGTMPDGSLVKPGTYYYVINSESGNFKYEPEKGFITVFY